MDKEIIKFIRSNYNLSQREFAKMINCSFSLVALIEIGKRNVSDNIEKKIKNAFGLEAQDIESITSIIKEIGRGMPPFS
ncbi:helix-turn-helix transcriptional regulator [Bacillus infantis]|uniref:Helix-turn-helix transcriptional regulator n=1 Tax=Bacillus infantis TaxID=324767 RepID=A0A5D4RD21_9BACI|nr:helix-turn-helix transcriptional regulator [Bacillus infantis]TYS47786.1 helix-turn-helix transcriptional regulator [Bacillus infantis]